MRVIILVAIWSMALNSWAHEPIVEVSLDSVTIEVTHQNRTFIIHEVLPKQTLYTIAKAYGISVNDIYKHNPVLRDRLVKMNERIQIPLQGMEIKPTITDGPKAYYRVKPKETVFRLARVYFNMDIQHLMALNNLDRVDLEVGQKLLVGTLVPRERTDSSFVLEEEPKLFALEEKNVSWVEEKSVAFWHRDRDDSQALFVLHNDAPINSMVEINNPLFDRTVEAKVIGRIPEGAYTRDIDVILSHGVAEELGAIDPRFYVKLKFLK